MGRGQGIGKPKKGKKGKSARGRSTFLDLPSPTREISQPLPQSPSQNPPTAPLIDPHEISWGSDIDTTPITDSDSQPATPLTDPYQNPTLARAVTAFLQDQRNQFGPALSSPTTPTNHSSRQSPTPDQNLDTSSLPPSFFYVLADLGSVSRNQYFEPYFYF